MFDAQYAIEILPRLLKGAVVTIQATVLGMTLALILGLGLSIARMSGNGLISRVATQVIVFVRGTPLLVQLFFWFFILPRWGLSLDPMLTGVIGLGVHYGSYTAEVYRSGIISVPRAQWEAALALNFDSRSTWLRIILPQAIARVVPVLGNYMISMFKDTPLLATITVVELLGAAQIEAGRTYRFFEPLTLVGLIFFILSYASSLALQRLETWISRTIR